MCKKDDFGVGISLLFKKKKPQNCSKFNNEK